uniref:Uncharacterized protein n=1 Tax=Globodera rostochiensis TaxID=31243 RepID=A0A914H5W5_GLORO
MNKVGERNQQLNAYSTAPNGRAKAQGHGSIRLPQTINSGALATNSNKQLFIGVPTPPPVPRVPIPYPYRSKSVSQQQNANRATNKQILIGVSTPAPVPRVPVPYASPRSVARGVAQYPQQRANFIPTPPPVPPIPAIPFPYHHAKRRSVFESDGTFMMSNGQQRFLPRSGNKYAYVIHSQKEAIL